MVGIVREFSARHPDCDVVFVNTGLTDDPLSWLRSGRVDPTRDAAADRSSRHHRRPHSLPRTTGAARLPRGPTRQQGRDRLRRHSRPPRLRHPHVSARDDGRLHTAGHQLGTTAATNHQPHHRGGHDARRRWRVGPSHRRSGWTITPPRRRRPDPGSRNRPKPGLSGSPRCTALASTRSYRPRARSSPTPYSARKTDPPLVFVA